MRTPCQKLFKYLSWCSHSLCNGASTSREKDYVILIGAIRLFFCYSWFGRLRNIRSYFVDGLVVYVSYWIGYHYMVTLHSIIFLNVNRHPWRKMERMDCYNTKFIKLVSVYILMIQGRIILYNEIKYLVDGLDISYY